MLFKVLSGEFNLFRLEASAAIPARVFAAEFFSILGSDEELSILVPDSVLALSERVEAGWSGIKIVGPLDFSLVGVMAELSSLLAAAGISLLAVSSFDTDYLFVKTASLGDAVEQLRLAGHLAAD